MELQVACDFFFLTLFVNILLLIETSDAKIKNTVRTSEQCATFPEVTIPQGTLRGVTLVSRKKRGIAAFLAIPYAQPPIGKLRFSNPIPADTWDGTLNASVEGNSCPQLGNLGNEDCLYLNVYSPLLSGGHDPSPLPVMVFIHGGRFEEGDGNPTNYGPGYLLDADVVLVSMNYRLGPLGFLSTGDEVAPGNWGLKDQVLALQWVQKNIRYFGGDPDQVTIFGQSAGAGSVQLLTLSESTIGLFHKFISQSGAANAFWAYQPKSLSANLARKLGETFGCPTNTSHHLVECLRELDASDIVDTRSQLSAWKIYPLVLWGPTDEPDIEGAFLTDDPAKLLAAGELRDLPSITGILADDGLGFLPGVLPDSEVFEEFLENFDHLLPIILHYSGRDEDTPSFTAALKEFYLHNDVTTNRTRVWSNCVELMNDGLLFYPLYEALQKQVAFAENATFFYSFEYRGTCGYSTVFDPAGIALNSSVLHADELLYLFPKIEAIFGVPEDELSETDLKMIDTMVQLWTSFAINGTPTTTGMISNTTWVPYSSKGNYLRIGSGSNGSLDLRYNFLQDRMQFWNKLLTTGSGNADTLSPYRILISILPIALAKIVS